MLEQSQECRQELEHQLRVAVTKMDAAGLSVARLQDDNASLNDQVDNMREHVDQLQAKMIDAGIFVGRKIFTDDPSYITSYSKVRSACMQGDLNCRSHKRISPPRRCR